jgi:hypothetical protein
MATEDRIERTIGLVILAVLAVGCALVLRPFFTAVRFALFLAVGSSKAASSTVRVTVSASRA